MDGVKLPIHKHHLSPFVRLVVAQCSGCLVTGMLHGGYVCNDFYCIARFHKDCAEALREINHPSHPQHPLLLQNYKGDGPCDLCGQKLETGPCYSCATCEFKVDLTCGIKPPSLVIEHPMCHEHPLNFLKKREDEPEEVPCEICKDSTGGGAYYSCCDCHMYFHVGCVNLSKEVHHPCHSKHPLNLITSEANEDKKYCFWCEDQPKNVFYHCPVCNFTSCLSCTKSPPPFVVEDTKTHKHPLSFFPRRILCTCNICGEKDITPYMCLQCDFSVHASCIDLPQVININRHDYHRISLTHHIGPGYLQCGVCRKSLSKYNGAYSCSVCPDYAVHTQCATRYDVWDGVELEGIPDDTEDIEPFKVVGDNLITHFSHDKHTLRFRKDGMIKDKYARCEACTYPLGFDAIYECEECCFFLHEKCAKLPMKKRHVFSISPYKLHEPCNGVGKVLDCHLCGVFSVGFFYTPQRAQRGGDIDVICGSISEPFVREGHKHPLYFDTIDGDHLCDACKRDIKGYYILRCDGCDYDLCLSCASLPEKIWHSNDQHPLTLCCEEPEAGGKYWCDICEGELDPSVWFYACCDCGVTLHANCVTGDFLRLMPGCIIDYKGYQFEVVRNNHNTRPFCKACHTRCKVSVILKDLQDNKYICSRLCFSSNFV